LLLFQRLGTFLHSVCKLATDLRSSQSVLNNLTPSRDQGGRKWGNEKSGAHPHNPSPEPHVGSAMRKARRLPRRWRTSFSHLPEWNASLGHADSRGRKAS